MKECLDHLFRYSNNFFAPPYNQKAAIISSFVALLVCLFFLPAGKLIHRSDTVTTSSHSSLTASSTSTKWWIRTTPSISTGNPPSVTPPKSTDTSERDCPSDVSSKLKPGYFAYISMTPPLPNRLRSGAGESYPNIGQIEPGVGVKVIDGPLCANGLSWWLVEMNNSSLKGWTAMGRGEEQWIIPCTNPKILCSQVLVNPVTATLASEVYDSNKCKSSLFAIGIFAQVKQSDLLVIRSEPYTGAVIGYAGPNSKVNIIDGPNCAGGVIWWKVNITGLDLTGWAIENNLLVCSKDDHCN